MARLTYDEVTALVEANNKSGAPTTVIVAQSYKESRFDPSGRSASSTAAGLLGVTRLAVRETNRVRHTAYFHAEMMIARTAIEVGTTYLRICLDRKTSLEAALDYYGTGPGYHNSMMAAHRALSEGGDDPMTILVRHVGR